MTTIEDIRRIAQDMETAKRRVCIMRVIDDLSIKPDITIDQPCLERNLNDCIWFTAHVDRGIVKYKDVPLSMWIDDNPTTFVVLFPEIKVKTRKLRYGGDRQVPADWRETYRLMTPRAKAIDTEVLYDQIQKAHRRYVTALKREYIKPVDTRYLDYPA